MGLGNLSSLRTNEDKTQLVETAKGPGFPPHFPPAHLFWGAPHSLLLHRPAPSRNPAVSLSKRREPGQVHGVSRTSRVVPGSGDTMDTPGFRPGDGVGSREWAGWR